MAAAALSSRILGFVKVTLLVYAIGGTAKSVGGQAFGVANDIPTNIFTLIATGVLSAMIFPPIMQAIQSKSKRDLDRLLTLSGAVALIVTIVATAAAPLIVRLYAPDWPADWTALAVLMAYLCMPQLFFLVVYSAVGQVLNAHETYGPFAWAPAVSNVVGIGGIVLFLVVTGGATGGIEQWDVGRATLVCVGITAGTVAQSAIVLVALKSIGYRYRPAWGLNGLGHLGVTGAWMLAGALLGQLAFVVISTAAGSSLNESGVDGASLNSYGLALMLFLVPHGIFAVSIVTELFTRISRDIEIASTSDLAGVVEGRLRSVGVISIIFMTGFIVLGPIFTAVVWDARVIGVVLAWLAPGLLPFSQTYLLNRTSMALRDPRAVFFTQATSAGITGLGAGLASLSLPPGSVVIGIAAATTISQFAGWLVAFVFVKRRLESTAIAAPSWSGLAKSAVILTLAILGSVVAAYFVRVMDVRFG